MSSPTACTTWRVASRARPTRGGSARAAQAACARGAARRPGPARRASAAVHGGLAAPMPGTVIDIAVEVGPARPRRRRAADARSDEDGTAHPRARGTASCRPSTARPANWCSPACRWSSSHETAVRASRWSRSARATGCRTSPSAARHGRQGGVHRPPVGRRPAGHRGRRVRHPEVGAGDGRQRGRRARHPARARARATRRWCRTCIGLDRAAAPGIRDVARVRRDVRDVQPAQHQPVDRRRRSRRFRGVIRGRRRCGHARARATCRPLRLPVRRRRSRRARGRTDATRCCRLGVFEVAVSDTIGVAHPGQVWRVLDAVAAARAARTRRAAPPRHARHGAGQRAGRPAGRRGHLRRVLRRAGRLPVRARRDAAIWRPRTSCTCWTGSASRRESASPASSRPRRSSRRTARSATCRRGTSRRRGRRAIGVVRTAARDAVTCTSPGTGSRCSHHPPPAPGGAVDRLPARGPRQRQAVAATSPPGSRRGDRHAGSSRTAAGATAGPTRGRGPGRTTSSSDEARGRAARRCSAQPASRRPVLFGHSDGATIALMYRRGVPRRRARASSRRPRT